MRGCSDERELGILLGEVFPAYAGMFRLNSLNVMPKACFPRVCGDVPDFAMATMSTDKFSPRMRGCSDH